VLVFKDTFAIISSKIITKHKNITKSEKLFKFNFAELLMVIFVRNKADFVDILEELSYKTQRNCSQKEP